MSTDMINPHRRYLRPTKRKEREGFDPLQLSTAKLAKPSVPSPRSGSPSTPKPSEPSSNNQLLAGYLANEFLTKGTLFGQPWDPARSEAVAVSAESRKVKSSQKVKAEPQVEKYNMYVEVADLLKADGAHIPDVVNPTQLAHFLHL